MKEMPSICHVQLLTNVYKFVKEFCFVIYVIYILIDQFHINLFFVVSGLSPKSNRSKIRVVSGLMFGLFHGDALIFDYHFIFYPFRSSIQIYNFILHLHMNPGDKIYTID